MTLTDYIRPEFTPNLLSAYIGYHLQIFQSGRAKISLQREGAQKDEFFASLPKRDRQAYARQKQRSEKLALGHFKAIDALILRCPDARIYRLHEKGNNNKTADNAHLLASLQQDTLWLIMSGVTHRWGLETMLINILVRGTGKRVGEPSIFNEYVPTYDHDWQDAEFEWGDYKRGNRLKTETKGTYNHAQSNTRESAHKYRQVSPSAPRLDETDEGIVYASNKASPLGKSTLYAKEALWNTLTDHP